MATVKFLTKKLSGNKNRFFLAYFKHIYEPRTSVWGFFYVLIFNMLGMNLREFSLFLNFCILTPLFDTTLFFVFWFIGFLAVTLQKNGTALWDKFWDGTYMT